MRISIGLWIMAVSVYESDALTNWAMAPYFEFLPAGPYLAEIKRESNLMKADGPENISAYYTRSYNKSQI